MEITSSDQNKELWREGQELALDILIEEGSRLSGEEAENLERQLIADPANLSLRTKLLGYYFLQQRSEKAKTARYEHIIWIIQNHPSIKLAGLPYSELHYKSDGEMYEQAKNLWLQQVKNYEQDPVILVNAAKFIQLEDIDKAEELFKKAVALQPTNAEWRELLGHFYALRMGDQPGSPKEEFARKSLEQFEQILTLNSRDIDRFYQLSDLAKMAFEAGKFEKAEVYASELLGKANLYKNDWNYGNAIHHGNLVLGRLALKNNDLEKAKKYLIEAGKTPGSAQLNSFGPNMMLAKELLEKGEIEIVIEYFQLCSNFWDKKTLESWIDIVKKGSIPDFGAHLDY